jgi:phosphoglycolate phosphatase
MAHRAILFDKDGTLFDFGATWNAWAGGVIVELARGDEGLARQIAGQLRFDLDEGTFFPDSHVIAGTNREAAEAVARVLPGRDIGEIERFLMLSAARAPLRPAVPLAPLLQNLSARGCAIGLVTNDTEFGARAHLGDAGVLERFDFVAGFDSGYGAKPAPGPLLAFCEHVSVAPQDAVMVGDSTHDLLAGRAAGMATIAVLTGMAGPAELAPLADAVLPDIGFLPDWLDGRPLPVLG